MNFDTFYQEYFDRIFNYIFRRTLSYDDSLDILQDSFFKAHRNFAKIALMEEKAALAYLYRIASNTLVDYFRQRKKQPLPLAEQTAQVQPNWELLAEGHQLVSALKKLPKQYQEVLHLYFVEGLPYAAISSVLDKNESTLRSLVKRGITQLRTIYTLA